MEKRVRIQSSFGQHDSATSENHFDDSQLNVALEDQKKISRGRPKIGEDELRTEYIKLYCSREEKRKILRKHGGSTQIRTLLLEDSDE